MPRRPGATALPLDVRRRDGAERSSALVLEAVLDALPSPTLLLDADGRVLLANSAWAVVAEFLDDERIAVSLGDDYFAMARGLSGDARTEALLEELRELSRGMRTTVSFDYSLANPRGPRWFHLQASRVDQAGQIVVTHTDVTSRVRAEEASTWQARHDHLTQLPNRAHLHELIDAELRRPEGRPVTVLFLDVDGFKDVNDSLGHEVGDDLLRQLAGRLSGRTRAEDTVGRLGGDEFVVICRDCDTAGAEALAARCQSTFDDPFPLAGRSIRLSASIGVATAGAAEVAELRSTDLVRDADLAMYAAKGAGRNRVRLFTPDLRSAVQQKALVAAELHSAIDAGQLTLHYQPVVYLPTGEVTGVEALVRWQHPVRGLLSPGEFIPLAEQNGVIAPLTRWVLAEATRQTAAWTAQGLQLIAAVNISAAHFTTGTLVSDVAEALAAAGLPADRLIVELTETSVAQDPDAAAAQLATLRVSGVEVSIDDFGSGFSSLSQLVRMPAGVLKIDRSLVAGSDSPRSQSAAAMAAVVGLAQACGMRSLAEGVETAAQLATAVELGCSYAQGHHIARPMPAEDLVRWVAARRAPRHGTATAELIDAGT
ncbi:diguanylate cyclase (GGDEF) domain-containing protein [Modestobacter sp. DSM 44400]|uniref:putative bifunctional diguanylate cyclase/phosphodiesterase n=1 Tax=Modestobacter sp. DSM 44400 TaxID=1550230 RepID=UPI00089A9990|nr:EAL domain-containing protein [Modestobacter sp. DSM 44400]SDY27852.1 diguanylate cyclase (GGDEF) domain-containing protein [Modestobacter sp. DSM 44400]